MHWGVGEKDYWEIPMEVAEGECWIVKSTRRAIKIN